MRRVIKVLWVAGVLGLWVSPALAQRGLQGGFGAPMGGGGVFLDNKSVQDELRMTREQIDKVHEALQKMGEGRKEIFAKLRDLGQEERIQKMQELTKAMTEETNKLAASVLKPDQLKRFKQIELQQRSFQAFIDPEIQKTLKLSDDQKDKIKTLADDASKETRELFQNARGGGNTQDVGNKMRALRKDAMDRVSSLLTAGQKKAWRDLTGEPFEVKFEFPQRRGGN
jgi:Spy/CpxP family protein refolding chaperone